MAGKVPDRVADQRKEIVDHVIDEMGKGGFGWLKPWKESASPHNPVTGVTYHGRNRMHLAVMSAIKGYNDPRWVTFNQAKKAGWKIQKGAKSCIVEKWKMFPVKDSRKEKDESSPTAPDAEEALGAKMVPRCVGYWSVFNASQFDGVPPLPELTRNDDIEIGRLADDVKGSSRCAVREALGNEAYYVPATDIIAVPPRESFASNEAFLVTLLHEMGHSTGHPDAIGRDLNHRFGSREYAYEELIAEFSSMFSASDLGLSGDLDPESDHFRQHVAYLQGWQGALMDDPDLLFRAASAAEKATEFVIERYEQHVGHEAPGKEYLRALDLADGKEEAAKDPRGLEAAGPKEAKAAEKAPAGKGAGIDELMADAQRASALEDMRGNEAPEHGAGNDER